MKILHICGARSWGGGEQSMVDLLPELCKLGVQNHILGIADSPLHRKSIEMDISFIPVCGNKLNKFTNYRFLKSVVKQLQPDIIHLHTSDSLTLYTLSDLFFRLKTKTVFSKKGMGNSSSFISKYKYNYRNLHRTICVSNAVKVAFSKLIYPKYQDRLVVVYDGINEARIDMEKGEDIRKEIGIPEDRFLIGNIANHTNAKDLPTLMKTMNHLVYVKGIKNVHLLQIGQFSDHITPVLKSLIQEYDIQEYVTLEGFRGDASTLLGQMDVYVMSSAREGLPLTIYEAFLKKIPVVTTRAGGIPEAIQHEYNGLLCDVGDSQTLADNIAKLLSDREKRELFAERSYQLLFERFIAQKSAENIWSIYREVLQK